MFNYHTLAIFSEILLPFFGNQLKYLELICVMRISSCPQYKFYPVNWHSTEVQRPRIHMFVPCSRLKHLVENEILLRMRK